ncbi:hypothetical protein Tco_0416053 [Tanacetum coccineum]
MDGSSCVAGSGASLILTSPEGTEFTYALRFQFAASNNEPDTNSWPMDRSANGIEQCAQKVKSLVSGFANFSISQVPRSKNKKVDALSRCPEQMP